MRRFIEFLFLIFMVDYILAKPSGYASSQPYSYSFSTNHIGSPYNNHKHYSSQSGYLGGQTGYDYYGDGYNYGGSGYPQYNNHYGNHHQHHNSYPYSYHSHPTAVSYQSQTVWPSKKAIWKPTVIKSGWDVWQPSSYGSSYGSSYYGNGWNNENLNSWNSDWIK